VRASSLFTEPDFATKSHGQYPGEDFEKVLARSAFDSESVCTIPRKSFISLGMTKSISSDGGPLAKSLLYHLRNLGPDAVDAQFDGVRTATFAHARRQRGFARPVHVALGVHEWLYYGSSSSVSTTVGVARRGSSPRPSDRF
jgi:hypothetical protein